MKLSIYYSSGEYFWLSTIVYEKSWDVIQVNIARNRYFIQFYDVALIPLIIYSIIVSRKVLKKIVLGCTVLLVIVLSYVSNFRSLFAMSILGIFSSLVLFRAHIRFWALAAGIVILILLGAINVGSVVPINDSPSRITTSLEEQDYSTIERRLEMWQEAYDMAAAYPLFGVGLRNYYDNNPNRPLIFNSGNPTTDKLRTITLEHPHSILFGTMAETGLMGLLALVLLLGYFLQSDIAKYFKKDVLEKVLIVCFWILFSFSVFNPPDTLSYIILFWLLRAMILKSTVRS